MKKLLLPLLFVTPSAFAGGINDIVIMTNESLEQVLDLNNGDRTYEVLHQDFATPSLGMALAVETRLAVRNVHSGYTQEWTCNTQFVKTPEFFEISKTVCN